LTGDVGNLLFAIVDAADGVNEPLPVSTIPSKWAWENPPNAIIDHDDCSPDAAPLPLPPLLIGCVVDDDDDDGWGARSGDDIADDGNIIGIDDGMFDKSEVSVNVSGGGDTVAEVEAATLVLIPVADEVVGVAVAVAVAGVEWMRLRGGRLGSIAGESGGLVDGYLNLILWANNDVRTRPDPTKRSCNNGGMEVFTWHDLNDGMGWMDGYTNVMRYLGYERNRHNPSKSEHHIQDI
jgi:hypothetical protein